MNAPANILTVRAADLSEPADSKRIERFVRGQPAATPFHLPQWSRAIEAGTGQRALYLVAERDGAIRGVLPLTHVRSFLFGTALVSAGFAVEGGVLGEETEALAAVAAAEADARGCPSLELRGGPVPEGWARSEGTYFGFVRDLPGDEEAILKAIPRKQRAEVRRAIGFGLDHEVSGDPAVHYAIYAQSVRNLGTPVFPRRLFDAVRAEFGEEADILTVSRDGEALASVLSLYLNGTVYPYWGGGTFAARAARANEYLYYRLMCHAAGRGCAHFDFGRSKAGTGAFAFKKNMGFEPRPLVYARRGQGRETNPASPKYRLQVALWKRLPLSFANRLGPLIARGLG